MTQKIRVKTGTIEETLLLPLWGRDHESKRKHPRLMDEKAVEITQIHLLRT